MCLLTQRGHPVSFRQVPKHGCTCICPHSQAHEVERAGSELGHSVVRLGADLHTNESELRSCVKVEVAVLGSPSLTVLIMVSVDVKQH